MQQKYAVMIMSFMLIASIMAYWPMIVSYKRIMTRDIFTCNITSVCCYSNSVYDAFSAVKVQVEINGVSYANIIAECRREAECYKMFKIGTAYCWRDGRLMIAANRADAKFTNNSQVMSIIISMILGGILAISCVIYLVQIYIARRAD